MVTVQRDVALTASGIKTFVNILYVVFKSVTVSKMSTNSRDAMAAGMIEVLRPVVEEVDERVRLVRESQYELRQQIDELDEILKKLSQEKDSPVELDTYVKKLSRSKMKISVINTIVQNAQERLGRLHSQISKETAKRKSLIDPPSSESLRK